MAQTLQYRKLLESEGAFSYRGDQDAYIFEVLSDREFEIFRTAYERTEQQVDDGSLGSIFTPRPIPESSRTSYLYINQDKSQTQLMRGISYERERAIRQFRQTYERFLTDDEKKELDKLSEARFETGSDIPTTKVMPYWNWLTSTHPGQIDIQENLLRSQAKAAAQADTKSTPPLGTLDS